MNKAFWMMLILGIEIGLTVGILIGVKLMHKWERPLINDLKESTNYWFDHYIKAIQTHKI